jgi:hypothetical protein
MHRTVYASHAIGNRVPTEFLPAPARTDRRLCRPRDCSDVLADPLAEQEISAREVGTIQRPARTLASRRADVIERVEPWPDGPCRQGDPHESPYTAGHPRDRARGGSSTRLAAHAGRSRGALIVACSDGLGFVPTSAAGIPSACGPSSVQVGTIARSEQSALFRRRNNAESGARRPARAACGRCSARGWCARA